MKLKKVILGIGTNLGDKLENINLAYKYLNSEIGLIINKSKIYKSPPWGFNAKEDFFNSAVEIETNKSAHEILKIIKQIETKLGRQQKFKIGYSSRIIDIDILDYNNEKITDSLLITPHPHLHKRNFVLLPMQDICPNWIHPILNKNIPYLLKNEVIDSNILVAND